MWRSDEGTQLQQRVNRSKQNTTRHTQQPIYPPNRMLYPFAESGDAADREKELLPLKYSSWAGGEGGGDAVETDAHGRKNIFQLGQ